MAVGKLRAAVVGVGHLGQHHARIYAGLEETQLVAWLGELRFSPDWPEIERALDANDKSCPRCEAPLLERIAKSGTNAGGRFWGCSTYPRCDFTFAG